MGHAAACDAAVVSRACAQADRKPHRVEFLGWLPAFRGFGDFGTHPLFAHTHTPPPGYEFTHTATPAVNIAGVPRIVRWFSSVVASVYVFVSNCRHHGVLTCLVTLASFIGFCIRMILRTGRLRPAIQFAHSRHFQSQVMVPSDADLTFLTSVPFTYGQRPWVIEIEDAISLFHPFITNGDTHNIDVARSPYFTMVKSLLESQACRGIVTHMQSTAEALPELFQSEAIARKVTYAPLGVRLPKQWQSHADDETINLLFTNSWHQMPLGFYLRGGLDVLEAFDILAVRYPQLRLTIRSSLPQLSERHHRIIENNWVRVISRFTPQDTFDEIQRHTHIYLLPSARIHVVSVLQAMSYGQAVVVSDGWGMEEYITHDVNGLIVNGRYGTVSWMDREAGVLREDYRPMYATDSRVVDGLVESVSRLVEDSSLRKRLGRAARSDVETKHGLSQWNAALKTAFDKASNCHAR